VFVSAHINDCLISFFLFFFQVFIFYVFDIHTCKGVGAVYDNYDGSYFAVIFLKK